MKKVEQLYEGKAKKVYSTEDPGLVIVSYKDDATAFDGLKKGTITGKGAINNQMTNYLMGQLEKAGVPPTSWRSSASGRPREEGVHRPPGGHHPQHLRRLLRQALRRGGGHRVRRPHHRVLL